MTKVPGLYRRGNVYWYRRRVPKEMVESYGKKEETFSLETTDPKDGDKAKVVTNCLRLLHQAHTAPRPSVKSSIKIRSMKSSKREMLSGKL